MLMMTIDEVCARQHETANSEMYLRLRGAFWAAYDGAAFALARVTGYELKKHRTTGRYEVGFSRAALDKVLRQMEAAGITVVRDDKNAKLIRFSGGDTEVDDNLVGRHDAGAAGLSKEEIDGLLDLRRELLAINLADDQLDFRMLKETIRNLQIRCLSHIIL